jgi:hypothetical protein
VAFDTPARRATSSIVVMMIILEKSFGSSVLHRLAIFSHCGCGESFATAIYCDRFHESFKNNF